MVRREEPTFSGALPGGRFTMTAGEHDPGLITNDHGSRAGNLYLGLLTGVLLCMLIPGTLVLATPSAVRASWVGGLVISAVVGLRFAWIISGRERRLSETVFWLFCYVFLGLAPMVQQRSGIDPSTTLGIHHELDWDTYTLVICGMLAFLIGISCAKACRREALTGPVPRNAVIRRPVVLLSLCGLVVSSWVISEVGVSTYFGTRDGLSVRMAQLWPDTSIRGVVQAFSGYSLLVAFVALQSYRRQARNTSAKFPWILFWVVTFMLVIMINPISSPRYVFGTVVLAMLASCGLYATKFRFRLTMVVAVFALIFVLPLADAFRSSTVGNFSASGPVVTLRSGDYDAFGQLSNTILYVDRHGFSFGKQALGVALFWVPRSVWRDKPVDTSIVIAVGRGYQFTNLSEPLWGELYDNGGFGVLFIGMGLLGFGVRRADEAAESSLCLGLPLGTRASILPFYSLIILRGSLLQASSMFVAIIVFTAFVERRSTRGNGTNLGSAVQSFRR